jgi:ABC-type glycerol-3-phosphate transport system permease component
LSRRDLKLDILNTEMMAPIASWSLSISLVFVGTIVLSVIGNVSQATKFVLDWKTITGYVIVICITLLIFFLSMWGAHRAMSEAKKSKLTLARKHLAELSRELEEPMAQDSPVGAKELSSTITSWATYQRLVKEAPTWPFNAGIIRRLIASTVVPAVVYLIKILAGLGLRF